jgi:hypothetical protein
MPTPRRAFAEVAHALAGIDPDDRAAVREFYDDRFQSYPKATQALISDFLIGQTAVPSQVDLQALKKAVSRPARLMPELYAPGIATRGQAARKLVRQRAFYLNEQLAVAKAAKGRPIRKAARKRPVAVHHKEFS